MEPSRRDADGDADWEALSGASNRIRSHSDGAERLAAVHDKLHNEELAVGVHNGTLGKPCTQLMPEHSRRPLEDPARRVTQCREPADSRLHLLPNERVPVGRLRRNHINQRPATKALRNHLPHKGRQPGHEHRVLLASASGGPDAAHIRQCVLNVCKSRIRIGHQQLVTADNESTELIQHPGYSPAKRSAIQACGVSATRSPLLPTVRHLKSGFHKGRRLNVDKGSDLPYMGTHMHDAFNLRCLRRVQKLCIAQCHGEGRRSIRRRERRGNDDVSRMP